jgi:putative thioredoxin
MMGQGEVENGEQDDPFQYARTAWADGNLPEAILTYKAIEDQKPRAETAAAFLQILMAHGSAENFTKTQGVAEKNPKDAAAQHAFALAAMAQGQFALGFDALLASIKADRAWQDARARTDFVTLSEVLGLEDDIVIAYRRKLSSILFA